MTFTDDEGHEPVTTERGDRSKPVVGGWSWPRRIFVALVILIEFLAILLLISFLYPKGG